MPNLQPKIYIQLKNFLILSNINDKAKSTICLGVQTFHHLPFIHPTVNHGHLINGLGLGLGLELVLGLGLALDMRSHRRLITVKFYHRDTLARS